MSMRGTDLGREYAVERESGVPIAGISQSQDECCEKASASAYDMRRVLDELIQSKRRDAENLTFLKNSLPETFWKDHRAFQSLQALANALR